MEKKGKEEKPFSQALDESFSTPSSLVLRSHVSFGSDSAKSARSRTPDSWTGVDPLDTERLLHAVALQLRIIVLAKQVQEKEKANMKRKPRVGEGSQKNKKFKKE